VDGGSCSSAVLPDPGVVSRATSANRSGVFSGVRFRRPPRLRRRARLRPNRAGLPVHINLIGASRENQQPAVRVALEGARRKVRASRPGRTSFLWSGARPTKHRLRARTCANVRSTVTTQGPGRGQGYFRLADSSDLAGRGSGTSAEIGQLSDAELEARAQALAVVCRGTLSWAAAFRSTA